MNVSPLTQAASKRTNAEDLHFRPVAENRMLSAVFCLTFKTKNIKMSYTISKKEGLDVDYYGYETEYSIDFSFKKQKANVTIEIYPDEPIGKCRLSSNTDGYHWLQFFLSQEPETEKLLEESFDIQVKKCVNIFGRNLIKYEQEDKDSAWLTYDKEINEDFVKTVAIIIEPRFANRERFFE
jgi:hypothetical protein